MELNRQQLAILALVKRTARAPRWSHDPEYTIIEGHGFKSQVKSDILDGLINAGLISDQAQGFLFLTSAGLAALQAQPYEVEA